MEDEILSLSLWSCSFQAARQVPGSRSRPPKDLHLLLCLLPGWQNDGEDPPAEGIYSHRGSIGRGKALSFEGGRLHRSFLPLRLRRANPSLPDRFSHHSNKGDVPHPCRRSNQWIVALFRRGEGRFTSGRYHPPFFRCRVQRGVYKNQSTPQGDFSGEGGCGVS